MIIINFLQNYLFCLLGVTRWDSNIGRFWFVSSKFVFFSISTISLSSIILFCLITAQTFSEYVEGIFYTSFSIMSILWYVILLIDQDEYKELILDLGTFIQRKGIRNPKSKATYKSIDEIVEKFNEYMYIIQLKIGCTSFIVPFVILSIYLHSVDESFLQLFPATFPFNWRTPTGNFLCMLIQIPGTYSCGLIYLCMLNLVLGFCIFLTTIITDLENDLRNLNEDIISLENSEWEDAIHLKMRLEFINVIRCYSEAKLITVRFSNVCRPIIFPYLIYAITSFCCLFFQLSLSLDNASIIDIIHFVVPTSVCIFWLFVFCFFGNYLTDRYSDLSEAMYQIAWFVLPLGMQKDIPIFMALAQNNVYLEGYGGTQCSCELFKQIMNTTISYYMVLRQLLLQ